MPANRKNAFSIIKRGVAEELARGNVIVAWAGLIADLQAQFPEHEGIVRGQKLRSEGKLDTTEQLAAFVESLK